MRRDNRSAPNIVEARGLIDAHWATFQRLVDLVEALFKSDQFEAAAFFGQVAAQFAWCNHPGLFASHRLECILLAIGRRASPLPPHGEGEPPQSRPMPRRVVHILTQALPIGGHTRMAWRWITRDLGRVHSVVLTGQGTQEVPSQVREAVASARGTLYRLDAEPGGLLSRALRLRNIVISSDLVVLHIHPHDVVPIIALAAMDAPPPVVLLNHADHVFWVGLCICDLVANVRDSGLRLAQLRRGIDAHRCGLLPIPLVPVRRTLSTGEAKRQLGLPMDSEVILTVASPYKYAPFDRISLAEALIPVLEKHTHSILLAVGPSDVGPWKIAGRRTHGRVIAMGAREDPTLFYQAADIYVDSFPFSSLTSLLEAGTFGLPLVSYCSHPDCAAVLCADAPGLKNVLLRVTSLDELRGALTRLLDDPALRSSIGRSTREEILSAHVGPSWDGRLEDIYQQATSVPQPEMRPKGADERETSELDARLVCLQTHSGFAAGLGSSIRNQTQELAPGTSLRIRGWMTVWKTDRSLALALPFWWFGRHLETWGRRLARRLRPHAAQPGEASVLRGRIGAHLR